MSHVESRRHGEESEKKSRKLIDTIGELYDKTQVLARSLLKLIDTTILDAVPEHEHEKYLTSLSRLLLRKLEELGPIPVYILGIPIVSIYKPDLKYSLVGLDIKTPAASRIFHLYLIEPMIVDIQIPEQVLQYAVERYGRALEIRKGEHSLIIYPDIFITSFMIPHIITPEEVWKLVRNMSNKLQIFPVLYEIFIPLSEEVRRLIPKIILGMWKSLEPVDEIIDHPRFLPSYITKYIDLRRCARLLTGLEDIARLPEESQRALVQLLTRYYEKLDEAHKLLNMLI